MRNDLTDLTVIMDRSGSMAARKADAEGGLNEFVKKQQGLAGEALFTLVQFDTDYEFVHRGVPIGNVPHCTLEPRGSTALLDAVGRTIIETGQRLAAMNEANRPGLVVLLIITDGEENASHEYTREQIRQMITHQQDVYQWQFSYLGANQDAFAEGGSMGISLSGTAAYTDATTSRVWSAQASRVGRMRQMTREQVTLNATFTEDERAEMAGTK